VSEQDELRERLEALEGQVARIGELEAEVARLREDAATARALASMADRDVAEMRTTARGHTQVLNAIRETQIEQSRILESHGRVLETHGRTLEQIAGVVGELVVGQHQLGERVGGLATGQDRLTERVGGLEQGQAAILEQLQRLTDRLAPPANEQ
jgi:chromosome segregation ATPase